MKRILIATPIYPPSSGGPAIHSQKLEEYFGVRAKLFVFEKYNFLPFGVRHFIAMLVIFFRCVFQAKIIFALDGFSVAIPSVIVGKILRIPVVLRIGGDLVHEQYVEHGNMISMNLFYEKYNNGEISLGRFLKFKMWLQQLAVKNAKGIIFNTVWQKEMYSKKYSFPKNNHNKDNVWVLYNPIEEFSDISTQNIAENFAKQNFLLTSITRHIPFKNLKLIQEVVDEINHESLLSKKIFFETKNAPHQKTLCKIAASDAYIAGAISDVAPNQLLEALSLGIPSISTKNTGYYDLLKDNKGVIFIDTQSKQELKDAILKILNPEVNQKMRNQLAGFEWQYTWDEYFSAYERIIEYFCNIKH